MDSLVKRVTVIPRRFISDDRGWFLKAITGLEDNIPSHTGEVYITMGKPGQAKGGHFHPNAVEWFTIIEGSATLKLEDIYTHERLDIDMSLEKAITVFIPNNVAHIVVNNSNEKNFILLAYTDMLYNPKDTIAYAIK
ncbi:cupin domain-containing protein [Bacteroides sp. 214]|uniref:polysaccharide biosynthesis C-terminal domain-containing protein n=1 Tax=Bacteroides sp. 214 TaxID=2302935 RepID=UPI0013D3E3F3|nr:WxcM-like domain-containing protein [Bacteroides sp. 214]NDW11784.1 cupin domain-containing protein [Bacteroides sp. 214]